MELQFGIISFQLLPLIFLTSILWNFTRFRFLFEINSQEFAPHSELTISQQTLNNPLKFQIHKFTIAIAPNKEE